ncbi:uncharacterized protein LOC126891168 [Diabrotica virgifera virgifera]|uniref:HAT C-terminal dimerisation domain-containing protein n=1 Tax=Diabrotica virgifera virgifera TaxID=50390 RepID=A0ABM5L1J5_DIAVI|nr:uncharacterized protein LOC126891168 [Diabrotica virgifera virgifera]
MSCKRDYESGVSKRKKQKEEQLKKTNKSVESYFMSSKKVNEKTLADEAEREDEVQPEPSSSKLDCQIINIQDEDEVMLELETGNIEDKSKEDRKIGPSAGKLLENINKARFFSLIVDTTQDLGKKNQLSFVIRYTNFFEELRQDEDGNFEEYKKLSIEESFLGFFHVKDATALGLSTQVVDCLQNLGLDIHNIKRWDILSSLTGESEVTLKKLNPTRWASRHDSILAVNVRYLDIMKALTKIILESNKQEEVSEAKALAKSLDNFQFVMLTVVLSKIFTQLNITSKFLQGKETDLEKAARVLERSQTELKKMREDYEAYKDEATLRARKWNVQPMFSQSRQRKVKRHFDELAEDFRFSSGEEAFRVQVFYAVLDIVNRQIEDRFSSVRDVVQLFSVLFPTVLVKLTEKEIFEKAGELQRLYEKDIGPSLPLELISLQSGFKCELSKLKTVYDLASLLMIEFDTLATSFPEVQTALMLFLTLPVTVASAERSFSVLKRINVISEHQ